MFTPSDRPHIQVFDGTEHVEKLGQESGKATRERVQRPQSLHAYQHRDEGFAMAWSPISSGRLATGDNKAGLYLWEPGSNLTAWSVKQCKVVHGFR